MKKTRTAKSYSELITIPDFNDRIEYLRTENLVGEATFGSHRYVNQILYSSIKWKRLRREIILRDSDADNSLDLAHGDFPIFGNVYIHHINPITVDDILRERFKVYDKDNLICCSFDTHQIIHFYKEPYKLEEPIQRYKGDSVPWL